VEDAYAWYEAQREGLGDDFREAIKRLVARIETTPRAFPVVHRDLRRAALRRYPYSLFFRIVGSQVVVVACAHAKRSPKSWRSRR
jgi:plasmid stabilization system protein ParE